MNHSVTPQTRELFLEQFRAAEADRIFLAIQPVIAKGCIEEEELSSLQNNIAFFNSHGFETDIWVGNTIGHGGLLHDLPSEEGSEEAITPLMNFAGKEVPDTYCPLDPVFQKKLTAIFKQLASTGARILLLDDDFRLSMHTQEYCCLCHRHMERISELLGKRITREELRANAFYGKPNRYRNAFLQVSGDSLLHLARLLREAVDSVDPNVSLALCSCYCMWDVDGTDPLTLTEILRSKSQTPLLRLQGAPYWATSPTNDKQLPFVFEIARMFASFSRNRSFELMDEGDTYPRPRYYTPASYVELHEAVMRADGSTQGNLKYMFDYASTPLYETGYLERHCRNLPIQRQLESMFAEGEQTGVRVVIRRGLLKDTDCDLTPPTMHSPLPVAGEFLGFCGIPSTYTEQGICRAVFGESIQDIPDDRLGGGLILDAVSAILLTERGVDVGLVANERLRRFVTGKAPLISESENVYANSTDTAEKTLLRRGGGSFFDGDTKAEITPLLYTAVNGSSRLLAYRYENKQGHRFLVYLFNGMTLENNSGFLGGYLQQRVLHDGIEWISGKTIPAYSSKNPSLYLLCKRQGDALCVALFNCFADSVLHPEIKLDGSYRKIEFVNTSGTIDGDTVHLRELPAFSFAAFRVSKE